MYKNYCKYINLRVLSIVINWFNCNKLSVNTDKSKYMLFGTHGQLLSLDETEVSHAGVNLERVTKYTYLGIFLGPRLSFSVHVQYIKSKTLGTIAVLCRMREFIDHDTAFMLILPFFDYCDAVYHCLSQKDTSNLQKLQTPVFAIF